MDWNKEMFSSRTEIAINHEALNYHEKQKFVVLKIATRNELIADNSLLGNVSCKLD